MTEPHLDLDDVRTGARRLSEQRREARRDYTRYAEQAADADLDYRKVKARTFLECRSDGKPVAQAEVEADAASAHHRHRRDIAHSLAKAALLRIDEAERDSATLRMVGEWSKSLETVG